MAHRHLPVRLGVVLTANKIYLALVSEKKQALFHVKKEKAMRQIYIDLTSERAKPPAQAVGCVGEHNATELLISVPRALIDASDYQVVVFQSGPLIFRSRRIYPDSDRNGAYREGVCIHCLLGRHLTVEQCLGLQVEGWKLGADGQPSLIGKTAFLPRLTLTASPQGRPSLGFDGSYEDIQRAVDQAHTSTLKAALSTLQTPRLSAARLK